MDNNKEQIKIIFEAKIRRAPAYVMRIHVNKTEVNGNTLSLLQNIPD